MALIDDMTVYPFSKVFRQTNSASDSVYTVNAFFSWVMQLFDEPGYMTFPKPMKYNTPTSYTMLNGWFLDNGDGSEILKYLFGGDIGTTGYTNDVLVLDYDTITTDFVASDKDKIVLDDASSVGPLLSYKLSYETAGKGRIWVRDTNTNGQIADSSAVTISGSASVIADGASFTGDELYANPYALATFPGSPNPQCYFYWLEPKSQVYERVVEWSALNNFDRGAFDILIPVQIGGVLNNSGLVDIFARQTGDTFTHVKDVDLSAGARTPISLETAADSVNITRGEWYLLYDASTGAGAFTVGDVIQNVSTGSTSDPSWYAEVVAVVEFAVNTTGMLTLRALRGTIADNDSIFVGTVDTADANGTVGDTFFTYTGGTDPTTIPQVMTGSVTSAKRILRGVDAAENYLVMQVDHDHASVTGTARNDYYKTFTTADTVTGATDGSVTPDADSTTVISGFSDITIAHINGTAAHGGTTGTFTPGERVTWTGGGVGVVVKDNGTDTITLANVDEAGSGVPVNTDVITGDISGATCTVAAGGFTYANTATFAFPLQSAFTYAVVIEGGSIYQAGRTFTDINAYCQFRSGDGAQGESATDPRKVMFTSNGTTTTELNGEAYITAKSAYSVSKSYPFGQKAGDSFFAAQGVWIEGMATSDFNNTRLTDDAGNPQQPDVSITLTVSNTRARDRILVAERDGTKFLPLKTQYTSHATLNTQGDSQFDQNAAGGGFPNDTPSSGAFFVIDNTTNEEHYYRYDSWSNTGGSGDDGLLVLSASDSGTAAATGNGSGGINGTTGYQYLTASAAIFDDVQVGDIIRRTNNEGGWAYVTAVTSTTEIETTKLTSAANVYWDSTATADTFETNRLVEAYDGSDTFYIPYLSVIETTGTEGTPGEETQTLTYAQNRNLIGIFRNVDPAAVTPIQSVELTATLTTGGATFNVIRTEDEVGVY